MRNIVSTKDVYSLSAGEFIHNVVKTYYAFIQKDIIFEHPAIFVTGQPGIGKSQSIKQIAKELEQLTGKIVIVTDIRLLLFNPIDLRGIPVADMQKQVAVWLKPQIFSLNPDNEHIHVLFLDELTAAPSSIQAAAYQIALDKKLGEHELPKNTFVIAAGNRMEDHAIVYEMPSALKNRFMHFEIKNDFNDWMDWAVAKNIHPEIISYLKLNPHRLNAERQNSESNIIVTPRSWELLSKLLYTVGGSLEDNEQIVASVLGKSLSQLIIRYKDATDIQRIIDGSYVEVPKNIAELQNIVELLSTTIDDYMQDVHKIENVLEYIHQLPTDYGLRIFKKIAQYDNPACELTEITAFNEFLDKIGMSVDG